MSENRYSEQYLHLRRRKSETGEKFI